MTLQARVKAITEIVAELMRGVKEGRDINLNTVKFDVTSSPRLLSFLLTGYEIEVQKSNLL